LEGVPKEGVAGRDVASLQGELVKVGTGIQDVEKETSHELNNRVVPIHCFPAGIYVGEEDFTDESSERTRSFHETNMKFVECLCGCDMNPSVEHRAYYIGPCLGDP
jgi:hypothetical protein